MSQKEKIICTPDDISIDIQRRATANASENEEKERQQHQGNVTSMTT